MTRLDRSTSLLRNGYQFGPLARCGQDVGETRLLGRGRGGEHRRPGRAPLEGSRHRVSTRQPVVLFDAAVQGHGAAVCEWAGIPAVRVDAALFRDLATVVDGFGSIGRRHA